MTRIVSFLNEKGGCGKTTSVLECAYHLGSQGHKVLVADLDPQADATKMLVGDAKSRPSLFDLLVEEEGELNPLQVLKAARNTWPGVLVLPADRRLASLDTALQSRVARDSILKTVLSPLLAHFSYILIDLPPALGIGSVNALVASTDYLIPTDRSEFSREGIPAVEKLVSVIKREHNPNLQCLGVFMTGFEKGGAHAVRALIEDLQAEYREKFLPIRISHSVKVIESQREKTPVGALSEDCGVSESYKKLVEVIINGG